jgi:hypothetical protein
VIVSHVSEGNPRLSSTVNLVVVLNTELDHTLDELRRARAEIAEMCAEHTERVTRRMVLPLPLGLNTCTTHCHVDIMLMALPIVGPSRYGSLDR